MQDCNWSSADRRCSSSVGDAPASSEWSTILLPNKLPHILKVWQWVFKMFSNSCVKSALQKVLSKVAIWTLFLVHIFLLTKHSLNLGCTRSQQTQADEGPWRRIKAPETLIGSKDHWPISQRVYELIILLSYNFMMFYLKNQHPVKPQFCTCHDSWPVVTWAELWFDLIIRMVTITKRIFTLVQFGAYKLFVRKVPCLIKGGISIPLQRLDNPMSIPHPHKRKFLHVNP